MAKSRKHSFKRENPLSKKLKVKQEPAAKTVGKSAVTVSSKSQTEQVTKKIVKNDKHVDKDTANGGQEEESQYEVKEVVGSRWRGPRVRQFKIRWKGYTPASDTWEDEDQLDCPELIQEYFNKVKSQTDDEEDETEEFEVKQIIEVHYNRRGGREFLIRWKGCSPEDDTWEPEEHLNCPDMVENFIKKLEKAHERVDDVQRERRRKVTDRLQNSYSDPRAKHSRRLSTKARVSYADAD